MRAEGSVSKKRGGVVRRAQIVVWLGALLAAVLVSSSSGQGPPPSPPGLDRAIAAKEKHAERLLDKPGVAGVAVALNPAGRPVIEIYKETSDVSELPDELDGVPVESTTTGVIEPYDHLPTHRFPRPVPIGVSAGLSGVATGTIGVRVSNGTQTYALSNNHVFAGVNTASIGDPIISPGDADGGSDPADRIGTLAAYQTIDFNGGTNTMDAAIALTSTANVGAATPTDGYGLPSPITTSAALGLPVQKYGRTTGLQPGNVAGTNISVDVCYIAFGDFCLQEARFAGQISVSPGPFAAPGDSGSLIVTQGGNQPVALLFAGGDGLTIGTPIDLVLQRFGVTIDGTPPQEGPPTAPTALTALAGAGNVSLSWTAPSFDGGLPVSGYRIYRGTSPGSETFHQALGNVTSFLDTGLTNGTTYYYKVSAENGNGEGPLSNAAQATPTDLVAPAEPLPVLDSFNRANENPLSDAGRWSNGVIGSTETGLTVSSNQLACTRTTTCTAWRNNAQYGADAESWARLATLPGTGNSLRLYVRLQQAGSGGSAYMLRTIEQTGTDQVLLERIDTGTLVTRLTIPQELAAGDTLLLRAKGSAIEAWRHNGSSWARLGVVQDSTYAGPGRAGVGLRGTTARVDDFGARSLSQSPPTAPTALTALAGAGNVSLSWTAPSFDGGLPVSGYRIYRGTSPGSETFHQALGNVTSFLDTGLTNGTTYYYKVSAENGNGEGPLSNAAQATPTDLVAPAEPLPVLDSFNRANENPLSDAGRWSNGVIGSTETGLTVSSNQLACTRTTTCTAWRNNAQYGADAESWARLATLPGTGNSLRLYVRLQQAGSGGSAYMLRTIEQTGTDQVLLERIDTGTLVTRLTIPQELAAGDTLLLRAKGSAIEAWRHNGSSWARLGVVQDSTYAGPGRAGVGLRGTTARVDDFGARTMGAPPPDTEPPGAPGTLTATATSSSQIDLSWQAATDNVAVTLYRIESCDGAGCSDYSEIATTSSTSFANSGLSASTSYSYRVRAQDAVPNVGDYSNTASATTPAPPDTEAPSAPGDADCDRDSSSSQIEVTWQAATDNVAVMLYRIERCEGTGCSDFAEIALSTSTTHIDTGRSPSTSYSYRVRAQDAVPNVGDYSNTASATTPAPPDTEPPGAPGTLTATATSSSQINLSWQAATDNVAVTLYRIESCDGAGCSDYSEIATTASTSYVNSGLSASTSYSYRVRAQDAVPNVGDYSNTASATTSSGVVAPAEPLPTIDGFNRRNESPLSDSGRWSNGVIGSSETGLRVVSNTLACTRTTTCSAWRSGPGETFGPDAEVWARVTTLPGTNNQFRLYARLQQPGAGGSGYMLRTNQLTGTDQVFLERIDAGVIVPRLTISRELALGDTLLLRVKGTTLEAWLKRGTTWSLLGSIADSTYAAGGRVAVGIRGKSGRLDDFGAR